MKQTKQNKTTMMKKSVLLILFMALFTQVSNAQTTVTVGPGMNWIGYMNVFNADAGMAYQFGSAWAIPDMKTVVDAGNGSMYLQPNYSAYNATDPFWSNGAIGNKIMEANTYVEDVALLGQNLTFNGFVDSFTINPGYIVYAFIKVLDANNGYSLALSNFDTLTATGAFSVNVNIPNTAGFIPQYGFTVVGLNGNPVDEAAFGSVYIRGNQAPPAPLVNVTFQVQNPPSTPVYVFGSWTSFGNYPGDTMASVGNGVYERTIAVPSTLDVEYLFVHGATPTNEVMDPTFACTNLNTQFTNRLTTIGSADTTVCAVWETCNACIPLSMDDLSKEALNIQVSSTFIRLNAQDLAEVDGIEIFDVVGKKVFATNGAVKTNQNIDVDLLSNKLYLIRVRKGDAYQTVKSTILQ